MTIEKLKQLKYLKREIEEINFKISSLNNTLKSPSLSGKVKTKNSDSVSKTVELIDEQKKLFRGLYSKCVEEENSILKFIFSLEDSRMRQILKYKYIDGLTWIQIARRLDSSPESIKMAHKRFFER